MAYWITQLRVIRRERHVSQTPDYEKVAMQVRDVLDGRQQVCREHEVVVGVHQKWSPRSPRGVLRKAVIRRRLAECVSKARSGNSRLPHEVGDRAGRLDAHGVRQLGHDGRTVVALPVDENFRVGHALPRTDRSQGPLRLGGCQNNLKRNSRRNATAAHAGLWAIPRDERPQGQPWSGLANNRLGRPRAQQEQSGPQGDQQQCQAQQATRHRRTAPDAERESASRRDDGGGDSMQYPAASVAAAATAPRLESGER